MARTVMGRCLCRHTVVVLFVHVNFDHTVPTSRYDSAVVTAVAEETNFTLLGIMLIQDQSIDARYQIEDFDFTSMATQDNLSVVFIQFHESNIGIQRVFHDSNWLARPSIPDLDGTLSSDENLHAFHRKLGTGDRVVIRILVHERLLILENFEGP